MALLEVSTTPKLRKSPRLWNSFFKCSKCSFEFEIRCIRRSERAVVVQLWRLHLLEHS